MRCSLETVPSHARNGAVRDYLRRIEIALGDTADVISDRFRHLLNTTLNEAGTDVLLIFNEIENISPMTAASRHWREEDDVLGLVVGRVDGVGLDVAVTLVGGR